MAFDHPFRDGQPKPRSDLALHARTPHEPLQHAVLVSVGDARPTVLHGQTDHTASVHHGLHIDRAIGIGQRIADQVSQHFAQAHPVPLHDGGRGPLAETCADPWPQFGVQPSHNLIDQHRNRQVPRLVGFHPVRNRGVHQKLCHQMACLYGRVVDARHPHPQLRVIRLGQCKFGLRAQGRQRIAHLMGGLGHQPAHAGHRLFQPCHEVIEPPDKPLHLDRNRNLDLRQVVRAALTQGMIDHRQGREGPADHHPDQQKRKQRQHRHRNQRRPDDFRRQCQTRAARFRHHDRDPAGAFRGGNQPAKLHQTDRLVIMGDVRENRLHRCGKGRVGGEFGIARHMLAPRSAHGIKDALFARHHGEGGERQFDQNRAILDQHRPRDRQRRRRQKPVHRLIRGPVRIAPDEGYQQHRRDQQHDGRQCQDAPPKGGRVSPRHSALPAADSRRPARSRPPPRCPQSCAASATPEVPARCRTRHPPDRTAVTSAAHA